MCEIFRSWNYVLLTGVFPCHGKQQRGQLAGWLHDIKGNMLFADAALCSQEIPRWCRLSGVSQGAITFQSENKLTVLWQPDSVIAKSLLCKGLCGWRRVPFLRNLLRSQRTPNYILKKSFGKYESCLLLLKFLNKGGSKPTCSCTLGTIFLKKKTQNGIKNRFWRMVWNHHNKINIQ